MATTLEKVQKFLHRSNLVYQVVDEDEGVLAIAFSSGPKEKTYRDPEGEPNIQLIVRLAEKGEFIAVFAPRAWNIGACAHHRVVCEAASRVQCEMKLIRFDFDPDTGAFVPNVEIPLEAAPLCIQQLQRAISAVLLAIRRYDPVFRHAMETGEVDMTRAKDEEPPAPQPNVTRILELGESAGGLEAIERLLGGGDPPPVQS